MTKCSKQAIILICISVIHLTTGFIPPSPSSALHSLSETTDLVYPSSSELKASNRRREVFGNLRRAIFAGGFATIFKGDKAFAEETTSTTGRIVEFQVNNLDGEADRTGTFKIQLRPEWAPTGVARFEVSIPQH